MPRRKGPCAGPSLGHLLAGLRQHAGAPPARQSHLQPDAAGNGQGVAMLVVELDVANEGLIHPSGVAGRQGV